MAEVEQKRCCKRLSKCHINFTTNLQFEPYDSFYLSSVNIYERKKIMGRKNHLQVGGWVMGILVMFIIFISPLLAQGSESVKNSDRLIEFAGRQWYVKSGCGLGPGPNCFSDASESVWVDSDGKLHLRIRKIDDIWHSAEVYTKACTRYGMHRFFMEGSLDNLDKNVVAAPFLYTDDETEIDIEFTKWGQDNSPVNAQYVIQPYYHLGNLKSFSMVLTDEPVSTHSIDWRSSSVQFKSIQGHHEEPPSAEHLINSWTYTGPDIPAEEECLKVHINLWLYQGASPSDDNEVEIIVKDAQLPAPYYRAIYLPVVFYQPTPTPTPTSTPTPTPTPWVTIMAAGSKAWGKVGPSSFCNSNYKVALYAKTDIWYVQPFEAEPSRNVPIASDCTWQSSTHPWNQMATHLVPAGYFHPNQIHSTKSCPPPPLNPSTNSNVLAASCYP